MSASRSIVPQPLREGRTDHDSTLAGIQAGCAGVIQSTGR